MIFVDKQLRYDELKNLKPGDVVYEAANFIGTWVCVLDSDVVEATTDDGMQQLSWSANTYRVHSDLKTDSPQRQDYLVTKGFEHYGPQVYGSLIYRDDDMNFLEYKPNLS